MVTFWAIAALMVLGALIWLVPILFSQTRSEDSDTATHTDHVVASYNERLGAIRQEHADGGLSSAQLEQAEAELGRELLQDVRPETASLRTSGPATTLLIALGVPIFAVLVYQELGNAAGLQVAGPGLPTSARAPTAQPVASSSDVPSIEQMVGGLAARLEQSPDDGQGWLMLGRSYMVLGRMQEAEAAYARAYALLPRDVDVLTGYAETLARNDQNALRGQASTLIDAALAIDPTHPKALWLSGISAMQRGDGESAARHWQQLRDTGALNAEETRQLDQMIAEAQNAPVSARAPGGAAPSPAPAAPAAPQSAAVSATTRDNGDGPFIDVTIDIAPELAAKVRPTDSVFIFARASQGPPMPLAAVRRSASDLPITIRLDESMAMMPQMTIATFPTVVVGARISRTGNARPSPGDLQGFSKPLAPGDRPTVAVTIAEEVQ